MNTSINSKSAPNIPSANFFKQSPADQKRVEKHTIEVTNPVQLAQLPQTAQPPPCPTRPAPEPPRVSVSVTEVSVDEKSLPSSNQAKAFWANLFGAKLLVAGAIAAVGGALQKIVNALIAAAKSFGQKTSHGAQVLKALFCAQKNPPIVKDFLKENMSRVDGEIGSFASKRSNKQA